MDVPAAFVARMQEELEAAPPTTPHDVHVLKHKVAGELAMMQVPSNADLRKVLPADMVQRYDHALRKKPGRSMSGVAIVAVMSSPAACPHGKCVYCPGGPEVGVPQSYTGHEPSTMRSMRLAYDPYRVVRTRLARLEANGHPVDKVEAIVQGGTFPARDAAYQDGFIARIYQACNDGPSEDPGAEDWEVEWGSLTDAQRAQKLAAIRDANEHATCRVVGLTVETKPDWCLEPHLDRMLEHGATRIELGLQTLDEDVLRLTHRGHTLEDSRRALALARDAGFKVCVHMMPGQPRQGLITDPDADVEEVRQLFADPQWRPDMLKLYPTLVVQEGETPLKKWWKEGRYTPYDAAKAADVVAAALEHVPHWCRIQRVDRDIPTTHVLAGVEKSNLRQLAEAKAAAQGIAVHEIRAREAGRRPGMDTQHLQLRTTHYTAAEGDEAFFELVDADDSLAGYLRLRRVAHPHRPELEGAAIIRELKVVGAALALGDHDAHAVQHQGHGARLLEAALAQARQWGVQRLLVLAGVGVKAYYRRHGYDSLGPYMVRVIGEP